MKTHETKKYVLVGGYVESKNDGDRHYVSSGELANLYGLDKRECICLEETDPFFERKMQHIERTGYEMRTLYPRYSGNYKI